MKNGVAAAALLLGFLVGVVVVAVLFSGKPDATTTTTITYTTTQAVPPSCLRAVTAAEDGFALSAQWMTSVQRLLRDARTGEEAGIARDAGDMVTLARSLRPVKRKFDLEKTDCRAQDCQGFV